MATYNFIRMQFEGHDLHGWRPLWDPVFSGGNAQTICHDTLEHLRKGTSLEDELRSSGVILWAGTVQARYTQKQPPPWPTFVAREIAWVFGQFHAGNCEWAKVTKVREHPLVDEDAWAEREIATYTGEAITHEVRLELERNNCTPEEIEAAIAEYFSPPRLQVMAENLRQGYRQAAKVYGQWGGHGLIKAFKDLVRDIDRLTEDARLGDILILNLNRAALTWRLRLVTARETSPSPMPGSSDPAH